MIVECSEYQYIHRIPQSVIFHIQSQSLLLSAKEIEDGYSATEHAILRRICTAASGLPPFQPPCMNVRLLKLWRAAVPCMIWLPDISWIAVHTWWKKLGLVPLQSSWIQHENISGQHAHQVKGQKVDIIYDINKGNSLHFRLAMLSITCPNRED